MAIERTTPEPVVDMTTAQDAEEQEIVEIMEGIEEADIQMQDDGSAILGPEEEMQMTLSSEKILRKSYQNQNYLKYI